MSTSTRTGSELPEVFPRGLRKAYNAIGKRVIGV